MNPRSEPRHLMTETMHRFLILPLLILVLVVYCRGTGIEYVVVVVARCISDRNTIHFRHFSWTQNASGAPSAFESVDEPLKNVTTF